MIRFGQMPRGAIAALQVPVFALVGALATIPPDPVIPPPSGGGGGYSQREDHHEDLSFPEHQDELLEVLELLLMNNLV